MLREKTNAWVSSKMYSELLDFCTIDVSFISLRKILPVVSNLVKENGSIISLIKPQFEAGKHEVGKGGLITNPDVHKKVVDNIKNFGINEIGLRWIDLCPSPIKGPAEI